MSEILNRIDFAGRARFRFFDAFSRGPKRIFFTFSYEITRGAVRVIWQYPVGPSCSVSKRLLWHSSLSKRKNTLLMPVSMHVTQQITKRKFNSSWRLSDAIDAFIVH